VSDDPKSDKATLVERRQRFIDRHIQMDKSAVNVQFTGMKPEGSGAPNGHGMPKLPVGQHEVKNWPVLDLGETPDISHHGWKLEVGGIVENPVTLTWNDFLALPQVEDVSDFHCVTTWSRYDNHWRGVKFRTIAELAVPRPDARFVLCTGYDFMPARTSRTPRTCRSNARSTMTSCWFTRGRANRFLANMADRAG
jgi:DMSO/TMAO reductase YedYZ molybdopterin-dependent catalytic subunit